MESRAAYKFAITRDGIFFKLTITDAGGGEIGSFLLNRVDMASFCRAGAKYHEFVQEIFEPPYVLRVRINYRDVDADQTTPYYTFGYSTQTLEELDAITKLIAAEVLKLPPRLRLDTELDRPMVPEALFDQDMLNEMQAAAAQPLNEFRGVLAIHFKDELVGPMLSADGRWQTYWEQIDFDIERFEEDMLGEYPAPSDIDFATYKLSSPPPDPA